MYFQAIWFNAKANNRMNGIAHMQKLANWFKMNMVPHLAFIWVSQMALPIEWRSNSDRDTVCQHG
jgi:hypothetical protein